VIILLAALIPVVSVLWPVPREAPAQPYIPETKIWQDGASTDLWFVERAVTRKEGIVIERWKCKGADMIWNQVWFDPEKNK
jgi:hypothetical protein